MPFQAPAFLRLKRISPISINGKISGSTHISPLSLLVRSPGSARTATCSLFGLPRDLPQAAQKKDEETAGSGAHHGAQASHGCKGHQRASRDEARGGSLSDGLYRINGHRSEERRVGKESRSRWAP